MDRSWNPAVMEVGCWRFTSIALQCTLNGCSLLYYHCEPWGRLAVSSPNIGINCITAAGWINVNNVNNVILITANQDSLSRCTWLSSRASMSSSLALMSLIPVLWWGSWSNSICDQVTSSSCKSIKQTAQVTIIAKHSSLVHLFDKQWGGAKCSSTNLNHSSHYSWQLVHMYRIINRRVILYLCLGQFFWLEKYRHSGALMFSWLSKFENSSSQYLYKVTQIIALQSYPYYYLHVFSIVAAAAVPWVSSPCLAPWWPCPQCSAPRPQTCAGWGPAGLTGSSPLTSQTSPNAHVRATHTNCYW